MNLAGPLIEEMVVAVLAARPRPHAPTIRGSGHPVGTASCAQTEPVLGLRVSHLRLKAGVATTNHISFSYNGVDYSERMTST